MLRAQEITLLSGLLSALNLHRRIRGDAPHPFVEDFLNRYIRKVNMWGESAVLYLWLAALEAEQRGQHTIAEGLIFQVLSSVVEVNGRKGRALPSPYWGPEEALRLAIGFDSTNRETFDGHSYTAEPLISSYDALSVARSLRWEKITKVQFTEFLVTEPWEWFCWRAEHGSLKTTMPGMPESWARLQAHAAALPEKLPTAIVSKPQFAVFFSLVFPHRFGCELVKLVERSLTTGLPSVQ